MHTILCDWLYIYFEEEKKIDLKLEEFIWKYIYVGSKSTCYYFK